MWCGTEAGSYLRLIDSCFTQSLSLRLKDLLGPLTRVKKNTPEATGITVRGPDEVHLRPILRLQDCFPVVGDARLHVSQMRGGGGEGCERRHWTSTRTIIDIEFEHFDGRSPRAASRAVRHKIASRGVARGSRIFPSCPRLSLTGNESRNGRNACKSRKPERLQVMSLGDPRFPFTGPPRWPDGVSFRD